MQDLPPPRTGATASLPLLPLALIKLDPGWRVELNWQVDLIGGPQLLWAAACPLWHSRCVALRHMSVEFLAADKPNAVQVGFSLLTDIKVGAVVAKDPADLEQAVVDGVAAMQASAAIAKIFEMDPALALSPSIAGNGGAD